MDYKFLKKAKVLNIEVANSIFKMRKNTKKDKINTKQPTHHVYKSEVYINNKIVYIKEKHKMGEIKENMHSRTQMYRSRRQTFQFLILISSTNLGVFKNWNVRLRLPYKWIT